MCDYNLSLVIIKVIKNGYISLLIMVIGNNWSMMIIKGLELFSFVFTFRDFFKFMVLSIFLAICSISNLEAAISTVFAAFWTTNLSLYIVFASFSGNLQHLALEPVISAVLIFTRLLHSVH